MFELPSYPILFSLVSFSDLRVCTRARAVIATCHTKAIDRGPSESASGEALLMSRAKNRHREAETSVLGDTSEAVE
jgi:hypothetical protein